MVCISHRIQKKKVVGREEKRIRKGSDRKGEKDERDDKYTE
jgi:hypothetical protein